MADFISKLQYKTYEKGEFSDEQPRDLSDTLTLIKNFPWEAQRGADIQLSGPGVLIEGPNGDYLKVALYFNGKFSAYYLDAENHLYEYHTDDLNNEMQKVKDFFAGTLTLGDFEKHFFNIGNKAHVVTKTFEYKVTASSAYLRISFLILASLVYIIIASVFFINGIHFFVGCFFLVFSLLFGFMDYVFIKMYLRSENLTLHISKGKDSFDFFDGQASATYLKSHITEVTFYGRSSGKGKQILTIMQFDFKNGHSIKFPGMLIDPIDLLQKLPDGIKINYLEQFSPFRKSLWDYVR